jgi:hypothetical protein
MKDIHPMIRKWWMDKGFVIETMGETDKFLYGHRSGDGDNYCIIIADLFATPIIYRPIEWDTHNIFEKDWYSEEETLRMIKLSAFL